MPSAATLLTLVRRNKMLSQHRPCTYLIPILGCMTSPDPLALRPDLTLTLPPGLPFPEVSPPCKCTFPPLPPPSPPCTDTDPLSVPLEPPDMRLSPPVASESPVPAVMLRLPPQTEPPPAVKLSVPPIPSYFVPEISSIAPPSLFERSL